jgi:hypothetical protein
MEIKLSMIRVVHLSSGEQVITKLTEVKDRDVDPFCYMFTVPMLLTLIPGETAEDAKINYLPWSPFSSSVEYKVSFDKIISVAEPLDYVLDSYLNIVQPKYPVLDPREFEQYLQNRRNKNV